MPLIHRILSNLRGGGGDTGGPSASDFGSAGGGTDLFINAAGYVLVPVTGIIVTVAVLASWRRRRIIAKLRAKHEQTIRWWMEKQESEIAKKHQFHEVEREKRAKSPELQRKMSFIEGSQEELSKTRYRLDMEKAFQLWTTGHDLGCESALLRKLVVMMGSDWNFDLQECLVHLKVDFAYERNLCEIVANVQKTRAVKQIDPITWKKAKETSTALNRRYYRQFFQLIFMSSRIRILSLVTSAGVCALTSMLEHGSTVCREKLIAAILEPPGSGSSSMKPGNFPNVLQWAFLDLSFSILLSLSYFLNTLADKIAARSRQDMWSQVFRKLARCDTEFFDRHKVSELLGLEELESRLTQAENNLYTIITSIVDVITRGALFCQRNPRLAAWVVVSWGMMDRLKNFLGSVQAFLLGWDLEKYEGYEEAISSTGFLSSTSSIPSSQKTSSADGDVASSPVVEYKDLIPNMKELRQFGREVELMEAIVKYKYGSAKGSWMDVRCMLDLLQDLYPTFSGWLLKIVRLACMWFASVLVREGYVTTFDPSHLRVLIDEMWNQLNSAQSSLSLDVVKKYAPDAAVVLHFLQVQPKIEKTSGYIPSNFRGEIEFRNVHFAFPNRRDRKILRGLSFRVSAGTTVGLVGPSGCGKSTTLLLLQRFYDPDEGQIMLDNRNLKDYDVHWLRSRIGVVTQEPHLWDMPIEENIRFGRPQAKRNEVEEAARLAYAFEFIMKLPEGFNTRVGRHTMSLSGGEKQRLVIARALLSKPTILLLDEATSALDAISEGEVQQAIKSVSQHCTCVSVAHRLGTIRHAQTIVVMKDGIAVEIGTHEALCALKLSGNPGVYATLIRQTASTHSSTDDLNEKDKDTSGTPAAARNPTPQGGDRLELRKALLPRLSTTDSIPCSTPTPSGSFPPLPLPCSSGKVSPLVFTSAQFPSVAAAKLIPTTLTSNTVVISSGSTKTTENNGNNSQPSSQLEALQFHLHKLETFAKKYHDSALQGEISAVNQQIEKLLLLPPQQAATAPARRLSHPELEALQTIEEVVTDD